MGLFNADNQAFQSTVTGIRTFWNPENPTHPGNLAVMAFYLLGVWSAVFHFANGLWTGAIAWGLTVTANAQRRWGHLCLMLGVALFIVGTTAWAAFTIAPAARGDTSRWDDITLTHPDKPGPVMRARQAAARDPCGNPTLSRPVSLPRYYLSCPRNESLW